MKTMHQASAFAALGCTLTVALAVPPASYARTVYDAGAALYANCTAASGAYANPYTDENGGIWSYHLSTYNGVPNGDVTLIGAVRPTAYGTANTGSIAGFAVTTANKGQSVRVNISGHAITTSSATGAEPLADKELFMFPGNASNQCSHVRFTAPEAGWYSAFVSAHDLVRGAVNHESSSADVCVLAQGKLLVSCPVSLEDQDTRRFDFQMPVRHLEAGDTIDVLVGYCKGNANDDTGVKFIVTKEDEGAFYDSGLAMSTNVATRYETPFGTIADGMWYTLIATTDDATTAPANVSSAAGSRLSTQGTRSTYLKGFASNATGSNPYILVNTASEITEKAAPGELAVHPNASTLTKWPVIRFRPSQSGFYSASIVARDTNKGSGDANGVNVYLYVADTLATNAYVSLESYTSTAHLTFDSRLMVAGEPIDIVVSAAGQGSSDATAISAIIRRENGDVYDANKSFYDYHAAGSSAHPFPDALGGGATWDLGAKTNAAVATQFYSMANYGLLAGNTTGWWLHAPSAAFGSRPYLAMATNGIAGGDSYIGAAAGLLAVGPQEFLANPNTPGYRSSSPTLRASVPSDGIYRARGNARDLNNNTGYDGVRFGISAAGAFVPASAIVFRETGSTELWEGVLDSDRLWLKAGEKIDFVIDPNQGKDGDLTGLSACYVREGDAPTARVVNIDIGGAGDGRFSTFAGRGREGWSDWTAWNALRPGAAATAAAENCHEADGATKRNVTLSLTRFSDAIAAASGSTGCDLLDTGVSSSNTSDGYAFTLSKLTPDAAYTLYLYGAGDASFTVGGETKALEGQWFRADYVPCFARFEATADANGEITGTFAAADANGGAFSGLTIVGEFPEYVPEAFVITIH